MPVNVVYAKLNEKKSVCQHVYLNGGTMCNDRPIAEHRIDKWEFSKGRGEWFKGRRICFNCLKMLLKDQNPEATMILAQNMFLGGGVKLRAVS